MEGESLDEIFKKVAQDPNYGSHWIFNLERFQKLAIFSLLANPEDCRPQNCLVRKMKDSDEYEFVLIDNDRTFGKEFAAYEHPVKGTINTRVHCALFLFHEMIKQNFDERFFISNPFEKNIIIYNWINGCRCENRYQEKSRKVLTEDALKKNHSGYVPWRRIYKRYPEKTG